MARTISRWIPQNSRPFTRTDGTDAAIYFSESNNVKTGRVIYCAIAYHGKANKPDFYRSYRSAKSRAEDVMRYIEGRKAHADMIKRLRDDRNAPHTLKIGDLLKSVWGYDQTNVDYYEVTRVVGPHSVEIREVAQDAIETGFMSGKCAPIPGKYVGKPMVKRAGKGNRVSINSYTGASQISDPLMEVGNWTAYA